VPGDGFGVRSSGVEVLVFRVGGWDGAEVFGTVAAAAAVFVGGVEPDAQGAAARVLGTV
jgi:hypothetical protein